MALRAYFTAHVRRPARTIAWGHSLGGLITADLVQRYPGNFAGALPMCGVLGGSVGAWNAQLDASFAFKTLLAALYRRAGLNLDADLNTLRVAPRIAANPKAVRYMRRYTIFDGDVRVRVLTVHTTGDGLVPVGDEHAYAKVVRAAGHTALLRQAYIARAGHCTFTVAEIIAALQALIHRLDTGRWDDVVEPAALERRARRLRTELVAGGLDPGAAAPAYIPFSPDPFPHPYDSRSAR